MNSKFKMLTCGGLLCGVVLLQGCKFFNKDTQPLPVDQRLVMTTQSEVEIGTPIEEVLAFPMDSLPEEIIDTLGADESNPVVLTERGNLHLPPPAPKFIPIPEDLTEETRWDVITNPSVWGSVLAGLVDKAATFSSWLAVFQGILLLFSNRQRVHYGAAVGQLVKLNPKGAVKNVAKAMGVLHSNS